jgi:hypothetical protein
MLAVTMRQPDIRLLARLNWENSGYGAFPMSRERTIEAILISFNSLPIFFPQMEVFSWQFLFKVRLPKAFGLVCR